MPAIRARLIFSLLAGVLLPLAANGAGFPPWEFGMSKAKVVSFRTFAPYKSFSNGDLETYDRPFHGHKANVQFFFNGDRLDRIAVFLYEGTDPKGGIPAWRAAYAALRKDYGKIITPNIRVSPTSEPVSPEALAIAAAANADVTGESRMLPARQPAGMHVFARLFTGNVQGQKWYYMNIVYDPAT
jgi:hypothetical protein